jgi:hypothetical protein
MVLFDTEVVTSSEVVFTTAASVSAFPAVIVPENGVVPRGSMPRMWNPLESLQMKNAAAEGWVRPSGLPANALGHAPCAHGTDVVTVEPDVPAVVVLEDPAPEVVVVSPAMSAEEEPPRVRATPTPRTPRSTTATMAMVTMERVGRLGVSLGEFADWFESLFSGVVFMAVIPQVAWKAIKSYAVNSRKGQHAER